MLGSQESFEVEFPDSVEAAQRLACLTDPVILKRSVRDVASDLPPRLDIDLPLNLDTGLAQLYENVRKQVLAEYTVAGALVATLQLQLVCAHPWLRLHSNIGDSENAVIEETLQTSLLTPKIERVAEILREAFLNGRKVLVFSLFNRVGELVIRAIRPCVDTWWGAINGSTAQDKRQAIVDEFSSQSGAACLILNPKAAGAGLNITAATVVVHFTPLWNPALEAQASARAYRRGQDLPVTIYRVFYRNTVEEIMIERCKWKSEIANESVPISARDAVDIRRALEISPTG